MFVMTVCGRREPSGDDAPRIFFGVKNGTAAVHLAQARSAVRLCGAGMYAGQCAFFPWVSFGLELIAVWWVVKRQPQEWWYNCCNTCIILFVDNCAICGGMGGFSMVCCEMVKYCVLFGSERFMLAPG